MFSSTLSSTHKSAAEFIYWLLLFLIELFLLNCWIWLLLSCITTAITDIPSSCLSVTATQMKARRQHASVSPWTLGLRPAEVCVCSLVCFPPYEIVQLNTSVQQISGLVVWCLKKGNSFKPPDDSLSLCQPLFFSSSTFFSSELLFLLFLWQCSKTHLAHQPVWHFGKCAYALNCWEKITCVLNIEVLSLA